jgi:flagellar motor switch protein FliN/FliY
MATAHSVASPPLEQGSPTSGELDGAAAGQALVPSLQTPEQPASRIPVRVGRLPVEMDVSIPVRNFRVRNLLALDPGHLIESGWGHGDDVPLAAGDVQLAWSEFEVMETALAVRVTRLA